MSKFLQKLSSVPQRFLMVLLCFFLLCEQHVSRQTSLVVSNLIRHSQKGPPKNYTLVCYTASSTSSNWAPISQNIDIKPIRARITKYYYFGSAVTSIIGGFLGDRHEAKNFILVSILSSAIIGILTPVLWHMTDNPKMLIVAAGLFGMSHGFRTPVVTSILSRWLPKNEKTFGAPLAFCGIAVAGIINSIVTENLMKTWKYVYGPYYVYAGAAVIISLAWWWFGASDPFHCKRINQDESYYLSFILKNTVSPKRHGVPVGSILLSIEVWSSMVAYAGNIFLWDLFTVLLKQYMKNIFNVSTEEASNWSVLAFSTMIILVLLISFLSQHAVNEKLFTQDNLRRHCCNVGSIGPPIFMLAASFSSCNKSLVFGCLVIAMCLNGVNFCGFRLLAMDLSPNYSGSVAGLGETLASMFSSGMYYAKEKLAPNDTLLEYRCLLWVILAICAGTTLLFVIFGATEIQRWNVFVEIKKPPSEIEIDNVSHDTSG